jgi:hypothetical protein
VTLRHTRIPIRPRLGEKRPEIWSSSGLAGSAETFFALDHDRGRSEVSRRPGEESVGRGIRVGDVDPLPALVDPVLLLREGELGGEQSRQQPLDRFVEGVGVRIAGLETSHRGQQGCQVRLAVGPQLLVGERRREAVALAVPVVVEDLRMALGDLDGDRLAGSVLLLQLLLVHAGRLVAEQVDQRGAGRDLGLREKLQDVLVEIVAGIKVELLTHNRLRYQQQSAALLRDGQLNEVADPVLLCG